MRDRLPLNVRIGFSPTEPSRRQKTLPCLDVATEDAADLIKSGMIVVIDSGEYMGVAVDQGWRAAQAADATDVTLQFFIANSDYDAFDVQAAGGLTAYSLSDNYVFETGYFGTDADPDTVGDQNFTQGGKLTAGASGVLTGAGAGDVVLAIVDAVGSNANGSFNYAGYTPSATTSTYLVAAAAHTGATVPA